MRARAAACAALLALLLSLAGCGGGFGNDSSSGGDVTTTSETVSQGPQKVVVQSSENGFNPAQIYEDAAPGVVTIRSIFDNGAAEGSGFVLDSSGRIVTNAHVVTEDTLDGSGERPEAKAVYVEFPDRNVVSAKIVGFDPFGDVALIEVDPTGLDLHPLDLGGANDLVVGQPVAAIGSPFGEQHSLSVGIVSATDRSVDSLTEFQIEGAIQTDAAINPGNSGGPLLNAEAQVIGINQQIQTESGASDGVGFAIPISSVKRSLAQLENGGQVEYAYIGVSSQAVYPQLAEKLGLDVDYGGLVAEVVKGGPADEAGIKGGTGKIHFQGFPVRTGGDVILSVDGHKVLRPEDLATEISRFRPGQKVTLEVLRDGNRDQVEVTLGKRPESPSPG